MMFWIRYGSNRKVGVTGGNMFRVNISGLKVGKMTGENGHRKIPNNAGIPLTGKREQAMNGRQRQEPLKIIGTLVGTIGLQMTQVGTFGMRKPILLHGGNKKGGTKISGDGHGLTARSFISARIPCFHARLSFNKISIGARNRAGCD